MILQEKSIKLYALQEEYCVWRNAFRELVMAIGNESVIMTGVNSLVGSINPPAVLLDAYVTELSRLKSEGKNLTSDEVLIHTAAGTILKTQYAALTKLVVAEKFISMSDYLLKDVVEVMHREFISGDVPGFVNPPNRIYTRITLSDGEILEHIDAYKKSMDILYDIETIEIADLCNFLCRPNEVGIIIGELSIRTPIASIEMSKLETFEVTAMEALRFIEELSLLKKSIISLLEKIHKDSDKIVTFIKESI